MNKLMPTFIEVEINSFCNRKCFFCPNGWHNRSSENVSMNNILWEKIINELSRNKYSGWFAFHNYNEPLTEPSLLEKIIQINHLLPNVKQALYTNGDFLEIELLRNLIELDVKELIVSLYPINKDNEFKTNDTALFFEKLNLKTNDFLHDKTDRREKYTIVINNTCINIVIPNIKYFSNRAGSVSTDFISNRELRTAKCFIPNHTVVIDYLGNMKLCAEIFDSQDKKNEGYIIGNIIENDLLVLWNSEKIRALRERISTSNFENIPICKYCTHKSSSKKRMFEEL